MSRPQHPCSPPPIRSRTSAPKRLALLLTAVITVSGVLLAVPSSAEAKTVYKKAPSSSVARPMVGERFTISGGLGKSTSRKAALQRKVGKKWVTFARMTMKKAGRYKFALVQPSYSVTWRVKAPKVKKGGHTYPTRVSRNRTITRIAQSATTSATAAVKAGTPVTITAKYSPARKGRRVEFQVKQGNDWVPFASALQGSDGRASAKWPTSTHDTPQFRTLTTPYAGAPGLTTSSVTTNVLPTRPVQISAHRGFSGSNAENSWHAFNGAIAQRAEWIETDFRLSAPNETEIIAAPDPDKPDAVVGNPACVGPTGTRFWVIMHDPTPARTTDAATKFPGRQNDPTSSFTCTELKTLRVDSIGYNVGEMGVPTLGEFIDWITDFEAKYNYSGARIMVEFKKPAADPTDSRSIAEKFADLYDTVRELAPTWIVPGSHNDKAVFTSFEYATAFAPLVQAGWDGDGLGKNRGNDGAELGSIIDTASDVIPPQPDDVSTNWLQAQLKYSMLTRAAVDAARAKVAQVVTWTPVTTSTIQRAGALGVDVVTTGKLTTARAALLR